MLGFLLCTVSALPQNKNEIYIESIMIESRDVFTAEDSSGFIGDAANSIHFTTREYLILDLISLEEGDYNKIDRLLESERILRNTGLFTYVAIELDENTDGTFTAYIVTQDRFTLEPAVLFGFGGGVENIGGRLAEYNLLGTGTTLSAEALYTTENDIGLGGGASLFIPNFLRTLGNLSASISSNDVLTSQNLSFVYPYLYLEEGNSFGVSGFRSFGEAFYYFREDGLFELAPANVNNLKAFYSRALERESMVYVTALAELNYADRGDDRFERIMDNSGSFLVSFSSSSKDFTTIDKADYYQTQDLQLGGYGEAMIGRVFSLGNGGDNFYYISATGEQSYYDGQNYLFGQVGGGSGFNRGNPRYTFQQSAGKAFRREGDFIFATSFLQQTAWNWPAQRQLVMDFQSGLRGYDANQFAGDNRIISNTEVRWMPDIDFWIFNIGAAAFFDIGTTWETGEPLSATQWKQGAGLGIRLFNEKSAGINSILRVDAAWNFETDSFGGIIITTGHSFDLFQNHPYRLPDIMGRQFDNF